VGGVGGNGGMGGVNSVSAGTFNMSNTITNAFTNGAGITVASQNSGIASMVQQSVNVQANLSLATTH
jgi:hypothetical protein